MIRKHNENDLDQIMKVWYESSTLAHPFLNDTFVEQVKKDMRELYVPGSETWVYERESTIIGFISMIGAEIGGLFVLPQNLSQGIGTQLVNHVSAFHPTMEVVVFKKNKIGRAFYKKYGFNEVEESDHPESGEKVLRLKK